MSKSKMRVPLLTSHQWREIHAFAMEVSGQQTSRSLIAKQGGAKEKVRPGDRRPPSATESEG